MQHTLITFATHREAAPTLKALEASSSNQKNLYTFSGGYLLITGIGMLAAASQTSLHIPLAQEVWNFGIAGALKDGLAIGTVCPVQSVSKFLLLPEDADAHTETFSSTIFPVFSLNTSGIKLISSDFPIHHSQTRALLAKNNQIVDMEGYGIAYAAKQDQKPCHMWKIISDFAAQDGHKIISQHIDRLAEQTSEFIINELSKRQWLH